MEEENKKEFEKYNEVINDIKFLLNKAKSQAYKAVDNIRVQTYWQIGERIVREELMNKERADYGERLIEVLAKDIGYNRSNLFTIVQFYKIYPIVHTLRGQLNWTHYKILIKIQNKEKRQFYEQKIIRNAWSTRILEQEVKSNLYENIKEKGEIQIIKPIEETINPKDVFKDCYDFEFLNLDEDYSEEDFKNGLLKDVEKFLQELGSDFFIGRREVPILIGGNRDKVDLELYHIGLNCYILVEVKNEEFKHSHVSQMYSYLNYYKENKLKIGQKNPIGLIICKTKDGESVHYALGDLKEEIFVSEYKIKLPSEEEIELKLKKMK